MSFEQRANIKFCFKIGKTFTETFELMKTVYVHVYHGVTPCEMSKPEITNLISDYLRASKEGKKVLQLRYGKKQIEIVVERFLTQEYLKENTKPCPNCFTQTTKTEGCNKMTCSYCQKNFCWLCGILIELKDPYQHFAEGSDNINTCSGRLFEGVIPDAVLLDLDETEIEANIEFFLPVQDRNN